MVREGMCGGKAIKGTRSGKRPPPADGASTPSKEATMPEKYHVKYDGPRTLIIETPSGEWARWDMARLAAVEHIESHVRECCKTLGCLRRAANFFEHMSLVEEAAREEADELAQVQADGELL